MASKLNASVVIASVLSLLFLCGSAWGADSNGLISHWEFDEGAGTVAYDSAGENDGTIYGATWTSGQIGGGLSFDGDDYVDIGCQLIEEVENSFTAMAWFKLTAGFDQNLPHTILWQSGILGLRAYKRGPITADCLISGVWVTLSSGVTPVADTWYFVAETYDAEDDILKVYVNGDEKNSILCVPLKRSEHSLLLGVQAGEPPGNYMDGAIDDVRVYNRALSAEEIRELYQNGSSGRGLPVSPGTAVDNIERAIRGKVEAWKKIDDMLKKEREAYEALERILRTGDCGDLSYSDIVSARYEIYTAIEQGERSKEALGKSIENLEAALAALGFELVPKASTWLEEAKLTIR